MEPGIICGLLEKIRARPGLFLPEKDLAMLKCLLDGYALRETELNPEYGRSDGFWCGFHRYVEDYYHISSTQGWCRIIEFFSSSRAGAFDTFFQRYDEYLAAYREGKTPPPRF